MLQAGGDVGGPEGVAAGRVRQSRPRGRGLAAGGEVRGGMAFDCGHRRMGGRECKAGLSGLPGREAISWQKR